MQNNERDTNKDIPSGSARGFASMDEEKRREIASEGGKAAHQKGTAHEFSSEEAREAGRKGGQARAQNQSASNNKLDETSVDSEKDMMEDDSL